MIYLWWSLCTLYLLACHMRVTIGDSGLCCCAIVMSKIFWALINSFVCWFCTDLHKFCWFWASFFFRLSQKDHKNSTVCGRLCFKMKLLNRSAQPLACSTIPSKASWFMEGCFKMKLITRSAQPQACSTIRSKASWFMEGCFKMKLITRSAQQFTSMFYNHKHVLQSSPERER